MKKAGFLFLSGLLLMGCQNYAQESKNQPEQATTTAAVHAKPHRFSVEKTEAQWKKELSPAQYHILRERGTERPFSSPLLAIHEKGEWVCAACGNPIFITAHKYKSTCGWPTFDKAIPGSVVFTKDLRFGLNRTEVLCARCGSHLGHIFDDGPKETTGKRYCIDGVAMRFIPADALKSNKQ